MRFQSGSNALMGLGLQSLTTVPVATPGNIVNPLTTQVTGITAGYLVFTMPLVPGVVNGVLITVVGNQTGIPYLTAGVVSPYTYQSVLVVGDNSVTLTYWVLRIPSGNPSIVIQQASMPLPPTPPIWGIARKVVTATAPTYLTPADFVSPSNAIAFSPLAIKLHNQYVSFNNGATTPGTSATINIGTYTPYPVLWTFAHNIAQPAYYHAPPKDYDGLLIANGMFQNSTTLTGFTGPESIALSVGLPSQTIDWGCDYEFLA